MRSLQKRVHRTYRIVGGIVTAGIFVAASVVGYARFAPTAQAINQTFTVTTTADSGVGSLRQAIINSNAAITTAANPNAIEFNITGSGMHTIALQTALPAIAQPVIIDGTTQAGASCGNLVPDAPLQSNTPHDLMIEVLSSTVVTGGDVTTIDINSTATGSTIRGLVVDGIRSGASAFDLTVRAASSTIACNYFGVQQDGINPSVDTTNGGVTLTPTADSVSFDNNLTTKIFAGGTYNAAGPGTDYIDGLSITNSIFGTTVTFSGALMRNGAAGPGNLLNLTTISNATIGGSAATGNVVGGTGVNGDHLYRVGLGIFAASHNVAIQGNYVGIMPNGTVVRNSTGIGAGSNGNDIWDITIGGDNADERNYISGNGNGVWVAGADRIAIKGNYIGSGIDGKTAGVGNTIGINFVFGAARDASIGGSTDGERNIISGNMNNGINVINSGAITGSNKIQGNYIGVDVDGNVLGNGATGIQISSGAWTIGGANPGEGNVISGNRGAISWDVNDSIPRLIYGNIIGLKPDGETPAPNTGWTMDMRGTAPLRIGGAGAGEGNIVSGNTSSLTISFITVRDVTIQGNKIGVTKSGAAAGNSATAIAAIDYYSQGNSNIMVGGSSAAMGNTIAYNANGIVLQASNSTIQNNTIRDNVGLGVGLTVDRGGGIGNIVRQNAVYGNGGLGFDLMNDGVTSNDARDTDGGANTRQNYPLITASMTSCDGTTDTRNVPMFNSTPNTTFTIDYYANPSWNPAGTSLRQGEQWVSSETVTTDANGDAVLTIPFGIIYPSVTATDPANNTSEFGSISIIAFTACQPMSQRTVVTTSSDMNLTATWTGSGVPTTYFRNYPTWNGSQWIDNPQKAGLTIAVTVGGQPLVTADPPARWQQAYGADNNQWSITGHLATDLPEGEYDVVLTITDPASGLSMVHTYTDAVRVALPKITYTTTMTNNQTPVLSGVAADVGSIYQAYIVPAGHTIDPMTDKPRAIFWQPNMIDPSSGSWQVVTSTQDYIDRVTIERTAQKTAGLLYFTSGEWATSMADWYFPDLIDTSTVTDLTTLQDICTETSVQQRIASWWGVTIAAEQDCRDWFQQQYDSEYANTAQAYDQQLQVLIDDALSTDPTYAFGVLPEGAYDVYITGSDFGSDQFTRTFPSGLVIDLTDPSASLVTASDAVSPALTGIVSDPAARVEITIDGHTYTAQNNGDGTWVLGAGIIAPLRPGTYEVAVTVTDLAGNTATSIKVLGITADTTTSSAGVGELAATGVNLSMMLAAGLASVSLSSLLIVGLLRRLRRIA